MKFKDNFSWGVSTAAFQIEGAWRKDGKGPSIWDCFSHTPGKILNNDNADIACDHYNRIEEDIQFLKELGVNSYRFSLSWPRIFPQGIKDVNQNGIEFYDRLISLLIDNNIEPWVTLYHWDLPLTLQFEKDGWLNKDMPKYFEEYSEICFSKFGDRVSNWITINEPWVIAMLGYGLGIFPPGRSSSEEMYTVAHNLLIAHGRVSTLYKKDYNVDLKGRIGMSKNSIWAEPISGSKEDIEAAQKGIEFALGWFADPIYKGDYPVSMKNELGKLLPAFTVDESEMIINSSDFFGLNHYSTMYAEYFEDSANDVTVNKPPESIHGQNVRYSSDDNWKKTAYDWNVVPWGLSKLLNWIDNRYDHPDIYITENGAAFDDVYSNGKIDDKDRVEFLEEYINAMHDSIKAGIKVNGYFIWSLLDNFEWHQGYSKRFGLYYTDYKTLKRIPKSSAKWLKEFLSKINN